MLGSSMTDSEAFSGGNQQEIHPHSAGCCPHPDNSCSHHHLDPHLSVRPCHQDRCSAPSHFYPHPPSTQPLPSDVREPRFARAEDHHRLQGGGCEGGHQGRGGRGHGDGGGETRGGRGSVAAGNAAVPDRHGRPGAGWLAAGTLDGEAACHREAADSDPLHRRVLHPRRPRAFPCKWKEKNS